MELDPVQGSEQGKKRPCLIVQNDLGNQFSPTTVVLPITSRVSERRYPHEVFISSNDSGLDLDGTVLAAQLRCVDKQRLVGRVGRLSTLKMAEVGLAIKINLLLA